MYRPDTLGVDEGGLQYGGGLQRDEFAAWLDASVWYRRWWMVDREGQVCIVSQMIVGAVPGEGTIQREMVGKMVTIEKYSRVAPDNQREGAIHPPHTHWRTPRCVSYAASPSLEGGQFAIPTSALNAVVEGFLAGRATGAG